MNRGRGFPYFLWQEYAENWETLPFVKVAAANKAAKKDQKRVTLPGCNQGEKTIIYFETMISKNGNGVEKPLRCLILNSQSMYAIWAIDKNSNGNFISFPPRLTYFLELIFLKNVPQVNFYYKAEYEVDFTQLIITKKNVGTFNIRREEMEFIPSSWSKAELQKYVRSIFFSERLMEKVSTFSVGRIKNLLFNIPVTATEISNSSTLSLSSYNWITNLYDYGTPEDSYLVMVDPLCSINKSNECCVVSENGSFFSASLVLTNIENNINKFCILQLLKFKNKRKYLVYTRSGRIGYNGTEDNSEVFSCLKDAKEDFKDRFYAKTQNYWTKKHRFLRMKNKYEMIDTYFKTGSSVDACFKPSLDHILSTLDNKLQDVLLLFFGTDEEDLNLVIQKWLLKSVTTTIGIATAKQVVRSFVALKDVSDLLANSSKGKQLVEACNNYYMKMPHATNYDAPKTILCAEAIEDEVLMVQILAYAYLKEHEVHSVENPIKVYFEKFQWNITYLDHRSPEFAVLQLSLSELHGPTHKYKMDLLDAYKWHKLAEEERFLDKGNKMLLWHGTQLSNFLGIIQHGMKLPPHDANTSSMFGRALYFADVSSKSANYCLSTEKNDIGLLLLCEVSMGTTLEVIHGGDYSTHPCDFGGLIASGEYTPSAFIESVLVPDTLIPKGPLRLRNGNDFQLKYNEYVIYDERQVKIKYILKIKFSNILK